MSAPGRISVEYGLMRDGLISSRPLSSSDVHHSRQGSVPANPWFAGESSLLPEISSVLSGQPNWLYIGTNNNRDEIFCVL